MVGKVINKFHSLYWDLLKVDSLRYYVCYFRWLLLKKNLKIHEGHGPEVAESAISYNLTAFKTPHAAFGMARRMSLVIFPMAAILRQYPRARVLIIGPRTEDDIFWARALGMRETVGYDLFSYSPYIEVGDMHKIGHPDTSFDAVILGWVLAYSTQPQAAIDECKRILKPGGYLAVGMESLAPEVFRNRPRHNSFNTISELKPMVGGELIMEQDPDPTITREVAAIFRVKT